MFNLFRRKKEMQIPFLQTEEFQVTDLELVFFKKVFESLPGKYHFIVNQINKDFLLARKVNSFDKVGGFTFLIDQITEKKIRQIKPYYRIGGITIYNTNKKLNEEIFLDILDQIFVGFYTPSPIEEYDIGTIKSELVYIKKAKEFTLETIKKITGKENFSQLQKHLNFNNIFEIEIDGKQFLKIHDLEDGNFLAINEQGKIFGLFHDPFIVESIFEDSGLFLGALDSGVFTIDKYVSSRC